MKCLITGIACSYLKSLLQIFIVAKGDQYWLKVTPQAFPIVGITFIERLWKHEKVEDQVTYLYAQQISHSSRFIYLSSSSGSFRFAFIVQVVPINLEAVTSLYVFVALHAKFHNLQKCGCGGHPKPKS